MTKQEILAMKESKQIMKALSENKDLWDKELSDHLSEVAKAELIAQFGSANVLYTPKKRIKK